MRLAFPIGCLLLVASCGGQHATRNDAAVDADSDADADGDVETDAETEASCEEPSSWQLATRTIESVALVDGTARVGATQRLLLGIRMQSGCDRLAGVRVEAMPGDATDFVSLLASAWVPLGVSCTPDAPLVEHVVSVPGRGQDNLRVVVADESAPGGGMRLEYGREGCVDPSGCACPADAPAGSGSEWSDCSTDCSCDEGLSCVGYWGVAGPLWSCVRACSEARDCYPHGPCLPPIPDGAPYVCDHASEVCGDAAPCQPGYECQRSTDLGSVCADHRPLPSSQACTCDADCPAGALCVQGPAGASTCEIPCTSTKSCPASESDPLLCSNFWVCVFAD